MARPKTMEEWLAYRDQGRAKAGLTIVPTAPAKRKNKYGAVRWYEDGIWFDSKGEYRRYEELRTLEALGKIRRLVVHARFPFYSPGRSMAAGDKPFATYEADFTYIDTETFERVVEDFKNPATEKKQVFRRNCRLMVEQYGLVVRVVMAS